MNLRTKKLVYSMIAVVVVAWICLFLIGGLQELTIVADSSALGAQLRVGNLAMGPLSGQLDRGADEAPRIAHSVFLGESANDTLFVPGDTLFNSKSLWGMGRRSVVLISPVGETLQVRQKYGLVARVYVSFRRKTIAATNWD